MGGAPQGTLRQSLPAPDGGVEATCRTHLCKRASCLTSQRLYLALRHVALSRLQELMGVFFMDARGSGPRSWFSKRYHVRQHTPGLSAALLSTLLPRVKLNTLACSKLSGYLRRPTRPTTALIASGNVSRIHFVSVHDPGASAPSFATDCQGREW